MIDQSTQPISYREVQYFNQWWLRMLWLFPMAVIASLIYTLWNGTGIGNMGTLKDDWINWFFIIVVTGTIPVLLLFIHLVIEVRPDGIWYKFLPIHIRWHTIRWSEIQSVDARVYRPILEYGGWGIRYGLNGKAYNISGNEGVLVTLTNGKTIMFGSQHYRDLEMVIKVAMNDANQ